MVQTPPSSDTSITGVETVAAFRSRKFTSKAYNKNAKNPLLELPVRCSKYRYIAVYAKKQTNYSKN
jgi:hypothetical protein